jgi:hypothetical protein
MIIQISCNDDGYKQWLVVAIFGLIFMVILPPWIMLTIFYRNRSQLNDKKWIDRWGTAYDPYQPKAFWWQVYVSYDPHDTRHTAHGTPLERERESGEYERTNLKRCLLFP